MNILLCLIFNKRKIEFERHFELKVLNLQITILNSHKSMEINLRFSIPTTNKYKCKQEAEYEYQVGWLAS